MASKRPRDKEYKGDVSKPLKAHSRRIVSTVLGGGGDTCTIGGVVRQPKKRRRVHI
jgi:hypothetical protein